MQQQAAYDSVFHQLDQTQHHLWYSSWHRSRHPNAVNNTLYYTVCIIRFNIIHVHVIQKTQFLNHKSDTQLQNSMMQATLE